MLVVGVSGGMEAHPRRTECPYEVSRANGSGSDTAGGSYGISKEHQTTTRGARPLTAREAMLTSILVHLAHIGA